MYLYFRYIACISKRIILYQGLLKMKYSTILLKMALIINHASKENFTLHTVPKIKVNLGRLPNITNFLWWAKLLHAPSQTTNLC
jgi:hypothetical protein